MSGNESGLLEKFNAVSKLLSRYQLWQYRKFGPSGDPHRGQGRVLAILKLQPEISQKELGYLLDMRNQSLGELLVKLEKSGAITREPAEEDRRSMNIRLTEYGAKLGGHRKPDDIGRVFDCLSTGEQEKLSEILDRLSAELAAILGPDESAEDDKSQDKTGNRHHRNENDRARGGSVDEDTRESTRHQSGVARGEENEGGSK
ncbi:MAG: MarR family transcriptional regulator [Oscillospiraceae bacterium]|nr:MarR family transcriptional regulator [Oscillospiraceae bacterium]